MSGYFGKIMDKLARSEKSSSRLAASFCLGTFIALTPTIPLQTPLLFAMSWLLGLNATVTFTAVYLVNNPFTMIPIYLIGYALGAWFFEKVVGLDLVRYNPSWVESFNAFLSRSIDVKKYFGTEFCIWYLLFGGFLFATVVSVPLYPILKHTFERLLKRLKRHHEEHITETHENSSSK